MCGEHKAEVAALLERAGQLSPGMSTARDERMVVLAEALVHAVLHLAEELAIHNTIEREQ